MSAVGTIHIDDFYTGLKDGRTIAFVAPPANDPTPHAPPGFSLIFDDEFNDSNTIDVKNTQKDGYRWYVKGMWFPNTSPSMYEVLPAYQGASGVLAIKDAPVAMSWNFATTLFDDAAREGYRGTVFLPGKGIYYEARIACADLGHIGKNGWAGFWSGTMPIPSRPRNGNPPPWSMSVDNMPMPGWPGKWETIENDIMEYNPSWGHPRQFDSTIHDWSSGAEGQHRQLQLVVYPPAGTDYTQWHTYGLLWISASAENGWHGYRQVYFDGVPQQAICWIGNQVSETSQPSGSYLFSMCDGTPKSPPLWRNLMIGGAMGGTPNTFFDYVRVYAIDPKASVKAVGKQGEVHHPSPPDGSGEANPKQAQPGGRRTARQVQGLETQDSFFCASSGTVILVEPMSLISTFVVRSTSRSLPLKLTLPCTLTSYLDSTPSLTQNFTEPLAPLISGPLPPPRPPNMSWDFAPSSVRSPE